MSNKPINDQPICDIEEETVDCFGNIRTADDYVTRRANFDGWIIPTLCGLWFICVLLFGILACSYSKDYSKFIAFITIFAIMLSPVALMIVLWLYGCMRHIYRECCWFSIC